MSAKPVREIDVRRQHTMSFRETWNLCIRGVKHRLFRSALTLAVVVLAVAFFMFLLSVSMFERSVAGGVTAEDTSARASQTLLSTMLSPASDAISVERLAAAGPAELAEAAAVSGLPEADVAALAAVAVREKTYADWLAELPVGKRIVLVGKKLGRPAFKSMIADRDALHENLSIMVDVRVPGKVPALDEFLDAFPGYEKRMADFTARWNAAVAKAGAATAAAAGSAVERWVPAATEADAEAWRAALASLGFAFPPEALARMRTQLREANETSDVLDALNRSELRQNWTREFREQKPSTAEEKVAKLGDPKAQKLLAADFGAETLLGVAERHKVSARLGLLKERLAPVLRSHPAFFGLTGRQLFLLCISFLVCMVGIANAMLMAITERFREIATMKCLGATDGYILSQFMLEAALQGFFGGVLGAVVGLVIAVARGATLYGAHLLRYFPAGEVALCFLVSVAAGVLLSALASIQPSWSASRMAPMEAMRVE